MTAPILIVGSGPTGLVLANALRRYRVDYEIVERLPARSPDSKALALNVLSRHILKLLDLDDTVGAPALSIQRLSPYWQGKRLNPVDLRWLDSELNAFLVQPQSATEEQLAKALGGDESRIRWNHSVTEVADHGNGVGVEILDASGRRHEEHYSYVVGCDGKRSTVREKLQIAMTGRDYPAHFILGDFDLRWNRPPVEAFYFVYEDTFLILVPLGGPRWRVVVKVDGQPDPDAPVDLDRLRTVVAEKLGDNLIDGTPQWLSRASFYLRVAERLRSGRLFLAGDAAHLFSPIGGTGMNTGIQDAFDLAWRLATCWHEGTSHEALLNSYEEERLQAIKQNAAATDVATRLINREDKGSPAVERFLPRMSSRSVIREIFPRAQSGLGQRYERSPALCHDVAPSARTSQVGTFCVGYPKLLHLLTERGCTSSPLKIEILAFVDERALAGAGAAHMNRLRTGLAELGGAAHLCVIACGTTAMIEANLQLSDRSLLRRCHAAPGTLLAIRPDGIVAFDGSLEDGDRLQRWLSRLFSTRAVPSRSARLGGPKATAKQSEVARDPAYECTVPSGSLAKEVPRGDDCGE